MAAILKPTANIYPSPRAAYMTWVQLYKQSSTIQLTCTKTYATMVVFNKNTKRIIQDSYIFI